MKIWRIIFIALGILIELMSLGLLIYLIMIVPKIDPVAVLFFCVPFITFAEGTFVIYFSKHVLKPKEIEMDTLAQKQYQAAIFDMDGTILDTLEDLKDALNYSLAEFGYHADFTSQETRMFFGSGARAAVARALAACSGAPAELIGSIGTKNEPAFGIPEETISDVLAFYKPWYAEHCDIKTCPYPGIIDLVKSLSAAGIKTAVVSNKPNPAVQALCRDYFLDLFNYAAGETDGVHRKPAPDMVLNAIEAMSVSSDNAIYIGDSEVDIQTAANAGLDCICVDWGFRTRDQLAHAGAKMIVSSCEEIRALF